MWGFKFCPLASFSSDRISGFVCHCPPPSSLLNHFLLPRLLRTWSSLAGKVKQTCSAALFQPTPISTAAQRANLRQMPPGSQPNPWFQQFKRWWNKQHHRCPVTIRRTSSWAILESVIAGFSIVLHNEGSGVTTVTSQSSLARYFAIFQVRTHTISLIGGKK